MNIEQLAENAQQAEQFLKLMANKNRLMILCSLLQGEQSVGELNQNVPLAQSALSQHLASLRKAQLVATRREGHTIYYSLIDPKVESIITLLYEWFCKQSTAE
ncbi:MULTISPECIES: helix-turn-helix transcriptional regulator [Pseudoalteromonas]|jgi:DNA-binding transcriptional ArsR family regulator|uniref:Transcriptional regulator n=2 Tax=Pseudoalteromonas TaxID=53246 RepID=A0AAD0XE69_9GAMM|nr:MULTISPECIES: metalloregulator ArsR/SmtB family transcription factor [Pseudoalteromonas]MDC9522090.1 metalloregulator ArsR/SmtB family transcription factor [Pseudoalteromonas sp. Angola-31]GEK77202.1 transcriptional regulator [Pseudoalteromonas atlantica]HAG39230.1 transcriptional regulator [Pseudoalteromonas sp.]AYM87943.1 transcriptional regulator [Pseudoalteromonas agarivorans]ETJ46659.1 ArsR family transcriptional regulator [Pseudoalteromonas agarivorans]|tara:strand:+ start:2730 stop:3038 length:309 start_codon:yes stop_codon:yes gene_type:complete